MVNTLVVPQLLYLGSVIHMPSIYVKEYNRMIKEFIWNGKPPKVKYMALINRVEDGGLCLQDIEAKINSLKIKWFKKMMEEDFHSPWKSYLNTKFKNSIQDIPYYNTRQYPTFIDQFYNNMFNVWANLHFTLPCDNEEVCRQDLWHNDNIQKNGHSIIYKEWSDNNINFVQDIIDKDRKIMRKNDIENKYGITCKQLQYQSLVHAIPAQWKKLLKQHKTLNLNYHVYKECNINIDKNKMKLEEVSTRQVYWHYANSISQHPTSRE